MLAGRSALAEPGREGAAGGVRAAAGALPGAPRCALVPQRAVHLLGRLAPCVPLGSSSLRCHDCIGQLYQSNHQELDELVFHMQTGGLLCQVRPFIRTEETRSKIVFLSGAARQEALQQSIPPQARALRQTVCNVDSACYGQWSCAEAKCLLLG